MVRRFCCFFLCAFIIGLLCVPAFALEADPSSEGAADYSASASEPASSDVSDELVGDLAGLASDQLDDGDPSVRAISPSSISGGYFFVADCALGSDLLFYVPADFAVNCFATSNGDLVNMTNSTVYALCVKYPSYSVYASRFGGFVYRVNTSGYYDTLDLKITEIKDTNLTLLSSDPPVSLSPSAYSVILISVLLIFGCLVCFFVSHRR